MHAVVDCVKHYAGQMLPYMQIALPVYLIVRTAILARGRPSGKEIKWLREGLLLCFVLFCVGLASQAVLPARNGTQILTVFSEGWGEDARRGGFNFVPLRTIWEYYTRGYVPLFTDNVLANIGIFAPIGFCVPMLWPRWRKWSKTVLLGAAISCSVEIWQIFILRAVDIDDVILNTLGAALGYACFAVLRKCMALIAKKNT
mgnify:CR=1 FL=1